MTSTKERSLHLKKTSGIAEEHNEILRRLRAADTFRDNVEELCDTYDDPDMLKWREQRDQLQDELDIVKHDMVEHLMELASKAELTPDERTDAENQLKTLKSKYDTMVVAGEEIYGPDFRDHIIQLQGQRKRKQPRADGTSTQRRPHVTSVTVSGHDPVENFSEAAKILGKLLHTKIKASDLHGAYFAAATGEALTANFTFDGIPVVVIK